MARIVYGVSGEGSGHSSRAREIGRHLVERGHGVRVVSYDRGARDLADEFEVFETVGLSIATVDNEVSKLRTLAENLRRIPEGVRRLRALRALYADFAPDCVITDFEPMSAYLARHEGLPLVSIDNQHRMRYMEFPRPAHLARDAAVTETIIRAMVPRPDAALVTTFWFGPVKNERTFLFPPILRREVRALEPRDDGHVLAYFTRDFASFIEHFGRFPRERFLVYGSEREGEADNVSYRPFSREGFLADLAGAKAVIATAGFTLLTESLHLGKPYLALPMRGQFEQELNALLLEELGYGRNGREATAETVGDFLYRLPEYRAALAAYPSGAGGPDGRLTDRLDALLADDCAELHALRRRRREVGNAPPVGGRSQPG
jgi:uncharacterized protein (TIGR00661 family)